MNWDAAKKILCVRLDYLGDVLMMTPAIRALKTSLPGRHITLLTSKSGAEVASLIPEIDDVIVYDAPWMKCSDAHTVERDFLIAQLIRSRAFDGAVIFTTYSQSSLPSSMLCYLASIPLRLGYCRENPYRLLTHWVKESEPDESVRHEVRRQLDLVQTIGCRTEDERLSLRLSDHARIAVTRVLRSLNISAQDTWLILHPGASASSRRYPASLWRQATAMLAERIGCPLLFTGSADEIGLIDSIRNDIPGCHSLAGTLMVEELAAVIACASVMICNNTGPAHIAAAVGTPIVDLYALTNPQHTPWQVPSRVLFHDVPCRYCYKSVCPQEHHDCLQKVSPETIVDAVQALLHDARDLPRQGYQLPEAVTQITVAGLPPPVPMDDSFEQNSNG